MLKIGNVSLKNNVVLPRWQVFVILHFGLIAKNFGAG